MDDDEVRTALHAMKREANVSFWSHGMTVMMVLGGVVMFVCIAIMGSKLGPVVALLLGAIAWVVVLRRHGRPRRPRDEAQGAHR